MPKTIPCWECKGPGCPTCNYGGVLSVYTQAEVDKLVKDEREACALVCEDMLFEKWTDSDRQILCAEAIRKRGN